MPLHYLMLKLDVIRLRITGHFRQCAEDIINRYDINPIVSKSDIEIAQSIVDYVEKGRIVSTKLGEVVRIADGRRIDRCLLINGEWCGWL